MGLLYPPKVKSFEVVCGLGYFLLAKKCFFYRPAKWFVNDLSREVFRRTSEMVCEFLRLHYEYRPEKRSVN